MAKFNIAYVKKNPVMFGAIFVVFGLLLWLLMNRGASSGGASQVIQTGPSEALQAAAMQTGAAIQAKQIEASAASAMGAFQLEALSRQIEGQQSIAILEAQYRTAELAANERMSELQTTASLAALQSQLNAQTAAIDSNNQFMVDYARVATDAATTQTAINAALQRDLGAQSLAGYKYGIDASLKQSILATIPSLKKKDRDTALGAFMATNAGYGYSGGSGDDRIVIGGGSGYALLPSGAPIA